MILTGRTPIFMKYKHFKSYGKEADPSPFIKHKKHCRLLYRFIADKRFRTKIILYFSLIFNTAYAVFQLGMGLYYRSRWFLALAAYYILLTLMRFFLLRDLKQLTPDRDHILELRRYRFCGIVLAAMTPALVVIVLFILFQNRGFAYHKITTVAMALYTLGVFIIAVRNIVKYRKHKSPLISATKAVGMTTASVSTLSLETAILFSFGNSKDVPFHRLITGISGAAVCFFVLFMAIHMIRRANRELKIISKNKSHI